MSCESSTFIEPFLNVVPTGMLSFTVTVSGASPSLFTYM